jgi:hypothetical protein
VLEEVADAGDAEPLVARTHLKKCVIADGWSVMILEQPHAETVRELAADDAVEIEDVASRRSHESP